MHSNMDTTKVTLILDGEQHEFEMNKNDVVLDIALSEGIGTIIPVKGEFV